MNDADGLLALVRTLRQRLGELDGAIDQLLAGGVAGPATPGAPATRGPIMVGTPPPAASARDVSKPRRQAPAWLPQGRSGLWPYALMLVLIGTFSVLLVGGYGTWRNQAPIPERVVGPRERVVTSGAAIRHGEAVFEHYDLMAWGSIFGTGSLLGPDFTAQALHEVTLSLEHTFAREYLAHPRALSPLDQRAAVGARVRQELKTNRYDPATRTLRLSAAEVTALASVHSWTIHLFRHGRPLQGLAKNQLAMATQADLNDLADFFYWTAWVAAAPRPGSRVSYTNNWPFDPAAGNTAIPQAFWWTAASAVFAAVVYGGLLFWLLARRLHPRPAPGGDRKAWSEADLHVIRVGPSQRKLAKYFALAAALFLAQTIVGTYLASSYVEGTRLFGLEIGSWFPYNVARTWHLQLAMLWITTAWLGAGLGIASQTGGEDPPRQGLLVDLLFWALVVVAAGGAAGTWLGVTNTFGRLWPWLGNQGWAYVETGRLWQFLLSGALVVWLIAVYRALRPALSAEHDRGGLTHLFLYAAIAIPAFYITAFLVNADFGVTFADYWRWWIVHLWLQGMFQAFGIVLIGSLMTHLGMVTQHSTLRALYFALIVLMASTIPAIGHYYYWNGSPGMWIGLGALFSPVQVLPLTLLVWEGFVHYRALGHDRHAFPYVDTFLFLIAAGIWNLVGAGGLGFIVNLPAVSYFEHGSWLTSAHVHGAVMGVLGMLGIAFMLFALRNVVEPSAWNGRCLKLAFWGLNLGIAGMLLSTLLPVGALQLHYTVRHGFFAARSLAFYRQPLVHLLLWLRIVPDTLFILLGVVPLVYFTLQALFHLRPATDAGESG